MYSLWDCFYLNGLFDAEAPAGHGWGHISNVIIFVKRSSYFA